VGALQLRKGMKTQGQNRASCDKWNAVLFHLPALCNCVSVCVHPSSVGMKTQPESKCPELLANYCDMLLRKTTLSKKLTSEEIELKLKEVVSLCPYSLYRHTSG